MTSETPTSTPPQISPILEDAWTRYGKYDKNAIIAQKRFVWERKLILGLGVAATALAVLYTVLNALTPETIGSPWLAGILNTLTTNPLWGPFMKGLRFFVVTVPIAAGGFATYTSKFNQGVNWVVLRTSAEALKKEIYRYRTQVDEFSPEQTQTETRDMKLAQHLKLISRRMMETQVNQTGLEPYRDKLPPKYGTAEGDDGFSDLTAEQYLMWRVDDQFNYYQKKAVKLGKEAQSFQRIILALGVIGSLLAAFQFEVWVAVSGALVTAFTSYLEFRRVESTLVACNRSAADLYDIRTWWRSLPTAAKALRANLETLINSTETVIQTENASWVQEMRDALAEAYKTKDDDRKKQEGEAEGEGETPGDGSSEASSTPDIRLTILPDSFLTDLQPPSTLENGMAPPETPSGSPPGSGEAPPPEILSTETSASGEASADAFPPTESIVTESSSEPPMATVSPEPMAEQPENGAIAAEPGNGVGTIDPSGSAPTLSDEPIGAMPTGQWIDIPPVEHPTESAPPAELPPEPHAQPETQSDQTVTEPQENEPSISAEL